MAERMGIGFLEFRKLKHASKHVICYYYLLDITRNLRKKNCRLAYVDMY